MYTQEQDLKKMIELNCTNNKKIVESSYLGLVDYKKSVNLQKELLTLAKNTHVNYVIGLEHPGVVTLGYRATPEDEIYNSDTLPIERISRGGLATIHSEGQLVVYPIINLRELKLGAREYVLMLLESTQDLLKELNIDSYIDEKCIGLYTKTGKIAFCGIQIQNGVSQHGLSLNVRNDLSLFNNIRSCGADNSKLDSLSQYRVTQTLSELYQMWLEKFKKRLG